MRLIDDIRDIGLESNLHMVLRERGKLIERRLYHNVFTITGRNLLSKLVAWSTIAAQDIPFTQRRARWMGVGIGTQLEVTTVTALNQPTLATPTNHLVPLQSVSFPTSTSVEFIREFATNEITITGSPVAVTEAAMFADVNPADSALFNEGTEDAPVSSPTIRTTLDPTSASNPPIAYKAFEALTKTVDFTLEIRWEFRF